MIKRWINDIGVKGDIRLFCLAHAGGGSSFFRPWQSLMTPEVAVTPIVLPGREVRWQEPAYTRMEPLIEPLFEAMIPFLDRPFAIFGHSMGATVAYEVSRRLASSQFESPLRLFVSARRAPHLKTRRPSIYQLPDDQFLEQIEKLKGTASSLLRESTLMQALLPSLRADFELNDTYTPLLGSPLALPVSALVGNSDQLVDVSEMRSWGELTVGEFSLRVFDGDHFYLENCRMDVLSAIRHDLRRAELPVGSHSYREV